MLTEQPQFTEKIRSFIKLYENEVPRRAEITFLKEACAIIDRAEASKADLLTACEAMKKHWWMIGSRITLAGTLPVQIEQIGKQAEAAIAKEKERRN